MSQFGTIGTPRMHPCVSHPSCSQFNAKDIILSSDGIARPRLNKPSNFDHYDPKDVQNNSPNGTTASDIELRLQVEKLQNGACRNEYIEGEERNRKYVEVSPGVWSYVG